MSDDYDIEHYFAPHLYARRMRLAAGRAAETHKHRFDHLSILAAGVAVVTVDGVATTYTAPACITIRAGVAHRIAALADVVWYCIHATEETDAARIDYTLIEGD